MSQGISNLEIDLMFNFFDRSTRKPTLTAQGQQISTGRADEVPTSGRSQFIGQCHQ
ncbi:hypothetical protein O9929_12795 [Vibrio lentus]|nr:hypothetical protein [Vibrio lentus]